MVAQRPCTRRTALNVPQAATTRLRFYDGDLAVSDNVIKRGGELDFSKNDYDWLGGGICFWEDGVEREWDGPGSRGW